MALIDTSGWTARTGITPAGADATSVTQFCADVSAALVRMCYPNILEPASITLFAFDAPLSAFLELPKPVRAISALYYHSGANGDSTVLDLTADLLVAGTDYMSRPTDVLTGWNHTGLVQRLNRSVWGYQGRRPPQRLAYRLEDEPGSVFVSATLGPTAVNAAVAGAAAAAVTLMFNARTVDGQVQSQSWNGGSFSLASAVTAEDAIHSPEVLGKLKAAGVLPIHVG